MISLFIFGEPDTGAIPIVAATVCRKLAREPLKGFFVAQGQQLHRPDQRIDGRSNGLERILFEDVTTHRRLAIACGEPGVGIGLHVRTVVSVVEYSWKEPKENFRASLSGSVRVPWRDFS